MGRDEVRLSDWSRRGRAGRGIPIASIRFQISLVLLLSALNGIVLVATAVAFFPSQEDRGGSSQLELGALLERIDTLQAQILADEATVEEQEDRLDLMQKQVASLGESASDVGYALKDYRWTLSARRAAELGDDRDEELRRAHYRVVGALHVSLVDDPVDQPPLWMLGTLLAWVVLTTLATLVVALALRHVLSTPLRDLATAASRVGDGDLTEPIPAPSGAQEFRKLGRALESMRSSLVASIEDQAEQNAVRTAMLQVLNDGVLFLDQEERVMGFNPAAGAILLSRGADLQEGMALQTAVPGLPEASVSTWTSGKLELDFVDEGVVQNLTVRAHRVADPGPGLRSSWVVVVRDVTKAVAVEGLKRDFLSVVTHELKTPLTVIDGYLKLLARGKGGDVTPKQKDLLSRSSQQVGVLTGMVQDLLDATRLEGGNLQLEVGEVDAGLALEECAHGLTGEAEGRGILLRCEIPDELRVAIQADPFRLQQVLGNLVRNALKFTDQGGEVLVSGARRGDEVALEITDTGRGIPPAALSSLFAKFYQVQRGDTRKAGGAGLGLYICDQLVRAMGGRMEVRSEVGRGSTFAAVLSMVAAPTEDA